MAGNRLSRLHKRIVTLAASLPPPPRNPLLSDINFAMQLSKLPYVCINVYRLRQYFLYHIFFFFFCKPYFNVLSEKEKTNKR